MSPSKRNFDIYSENKANRGDREDKRPFTFGCMRAEPVKDQSREAISFAKITEPYEPLNKEDRHRRFDLLLNNLRYGQK